MWDWLPTFCEVAEVKQSYHSDGISLLPSLLQESQDQKHEFLYWEFPAYGGQQAVRMGKWKAIRQNMFKENLDIELFDLENDIACQINVAAENPEVISKIEAIMKSEHQTSAVERFLIPVIE